MKIDTYPQLPDGYHYWDGAEFVPWPQVVALQSSVGWEHESDDLRAPIGRHGNFEVSVLHTPTAQLVGRGALQSSCDDTLELCDLTVDPEHQFQGLGTTILVARLLIADKLNMKVWFDGPPDETNMIAHKYPNLGFKHNGDSWVERLPRPATQTITSAVL